MAESSGNAEIKALLDLLTNSVNCLLSERAWPSLYDRKPSEPVIMGPQLGCAIAALDQLKATLLGPMGPVARSLELHVPACMRVAIEAHVAEVLREGDPKGVHVDEIARASCIDAGKLARVLRLLASQHIFKETSLDVFALTQPALALDTGRSVKQVRGDDPFAGSDGIAALIAHTTEDIFKADAYLADTLLDPATATSYATDRTPWSTSVGRVESAFETLARPENRARMQRFSMAMTGINKMSGGPDTFFVPGGYDFSARLDTEQATAVDVGGGVGSVALKVHALAPRLNLIVQDRPEVIEGPAKQYWQTNAPASVLDSGQVKLVAHDFFTPQPVHGADLYILRAVIHDWPDHEAVTILRHLRQAADPAKSRLLLVEHTISSLAPDAVDEAFKAHPAPYPLLPTHGMTMPYLLDLQMLSALNAQERTEAQFKALGTQSGWALESVTRGPPGSWNQLLFVPV